MKRLFLSVVLSGALLTFYSCDTKKSTNETGTGMTDTTQAADETATPVETPTMAQATLSPASGSNVTGTATFTEENGSITFEITAENLTPGEHAVHLHEKGDCSAEDASSAGGHWNPAGEDHGKRGTESFHRGDFVANMEVGEDGTGTLSMTVEDWTIGGPDSTNIVGKGVIIHAGADDFTSQPSGAAGGRVACGAIEMQ